jgi:hypothetical protein
MEALEIAISLIDTNECILFLGPQFAVTKEGTKIHTILKEKYESYTPAIDLNFDNLLIFKDPATTNVQVIKLKSELKRLYSTLIPHDIYQAIAEIPFQAIVCHSPDLFLQSAFMAKGIPIEFQFYSPKGHPPETMKTDLPIVYNVFGKYDVPDSMINTYDSFFDFVFTIMGDKNNVPINLKNILANAKGFIFLGFDLDKWYISLLIRKLNEQKNSITAFVTADNFAAGFNADLAKIELEKKMHPIEVFISDEAQGIALLDGVHKKFVEDKKTRSQILFPDRQAAQNPVEAFLNADKVEEAMALVVKLMEEGKYAEVVSSIKIFIQKVFLSDVFTLLVKAFQIQQKSTNDLTLIQSNYTSIQRDRDRGKISEENYRITFVGIVDGLTNMCDELVS